MALLSPDYLFRDITCITPQFVYDLGLRALVLDVDNTLTEHGSQQLRDDVARWLSGMRQAGIHLMIASNNTKERVAPFARKLGLEYVSFCCKPSPIWLLAAKKKWGLRRRQIALVGDQMFTDGWAGALYGVRVLLVQPMARDATASIRFKRRLERPLIDRYYKKGGKLL